LLEIEAGKKEWSLNKFVLISLSKILTPNEQNAGQPIGGSPDSKAP
jgi:hypothetical protein